MVVECLENKPSSKLLHQIEDKFLDSISNQSRNIRYVLCEGHSSLIAHHDYYYFNIKKIHRLYLCSKILACVLESFVACFHAFCRFDHLRDLMQILRGYVWIDCFAVLIKLIERYASEVMAVLLSKTVWLTIDCACGSRKHLLGQN